MPHGYVFGRRSSCWLINVTPKTVVRKLRFVLVFQYGFPFTQALANTHSHTNADDGTALVAMACCTSTITSICGMGLHILFAATLAFGAQRCHLNAWESMNRFLFLLICQFQLCFSSLIMPLKLIVNFTLWYYRLSCLARDYGGGVARELAKCCRSWFIVAWRPSTEMN